MSEHLLVGIASILVFGIVAQWLAWRLHLPSILLLLAFGIVAGPITGFLNPDEILGDTLFPIVSLSVALILFEGGLSLKLADLRETGHVVIKLVTIGTVITWCLSATVAYYLLGFEIPLAMLFGAILVVTGPTVIIPLLRQIRAVSRINSIIKWEGIVNDPIGALLAVLVFEAIVISGFGATTWAIVTGILLTITNGVVLGGLGALLLIFLLKRYWIPDYLKNAVTMMIAILAFTLSNLAQAESGLFTVTLMGVVLANQKSVNIKSIVEFKEHLGILLLSSLFIILSARLQLTELSQLGWGSVAFLGALVLLVRPLAVLASTIRSGLSWKEKFFLAWMAPRGIVAAAVTAIFALELTEHGGYQQAENMVPEMFFIIVSTVTIYGLSAAPLGRWLGVAQPNPQGVLIVGAHTWARNIASILHNKGFQVLLVDNNRDHIKEAKLEGLPATYASILSEFIHDEINLGGLGRLLALTPNDEVNSLAVLHFAEIFDRSEVYQLAPKELATNRKESVSMPLRGRLLFASQTTYNDLDQRFKSGSTIKVNKLTEKFDYKAFQDRHNGLAIAMFLMTQNGNLKIFSTDDELQPLPGDSLVSIIDPNAVDLEDQTVINANSQEATMEYAQPQEPTLKRI
ncbi:MAG: sodium:proton antiporter [Anaerolineae bacterium]|nr:sodium:proton antiporter [Anaerolineae bacterium]